MAAVAIPGLPSLSPPTKKLSSHRAAAAAAASSHGTAHHGSHLQSIFALSTQAAAASSQHHRLQDSPMAGRSSPLELFPTDVSSPGADAEAPLRRQRVQYTPELYAELAALLPGISHRASQVEILDAAVAQVKTLEDTAAVLEAYKSLQGDASPTHSRADVDVASREAVCFVARLPAAAARPGALTRVLEAFDRRGVEVLAATMTRRGDGGAQVTVTAAPAAPEVVESMKAEIAGIE